MDAFNQDQSYNWQSYNQQNYNEEIYNQHYQPGEYESQSQSQVQYSSPVYLSLKICDAFRCVSETAIQRAKGAQTELVIDEERILDMDTKKIVGEIELEKSDDSDSHTSDSVPVPFQNNQCQTLYTQPQPSWWQTNENGAFEYLPPVTNPTVVSNSEVPNAPIQGALPIINDRVSHRTKKPKIYNCTACIGCFTSLGHLKRHALKVHKNALTSNGEPYSDTLPVCYQQDIAKNITVTHLNSTGELQRTVDFTEATQPLSSLVTTSHSYNTKITLGNMERRIDDITADYEEDHKPSISEQSSPIDTISSVVEKKFEVELTLKKKSDKWVHNKNKSKKTSSVQSEDDVHCSYCNRTFNHPCYLKQHINTIHCDKKTFKCLNCGKGFDSQNSCEQHQKKHSGEKPFKCKICPKQFNHKTDLRRHISSHDGNKPYTCEICRKGFIRRDHMMKHRDTHIRRAQKEAFAVSKENVLK
ncbi:hypothetical protein WA026_008209 [Henosepilachna vigintioctopunctata]|uniref:C2H2-type domain-containing protein n=1 Tax=Henosepilachna vigintioctopunctata TaxID=420089 RepID=A0AAW1TQG7_9CUCU